MPIFNVYRINETQLAKVKSVRTEWNIESTTLGNVVTIDCKEKLTYRQWRNHIIKQNKKPFSCSSKTEHVFEI